MLMTGNRVAEDFEGTADFVIIDPAFELAGNTALLMDNFRRCETC
jgi:hypothetical protein